MIIYWQTVKCRQMLDMFLILLIIHRWLIKTFQVVSIGNGVWFKWEAVRCSSCRYNGWLLLTQTLCASPTCTKWTPTPSTRWSRWPLSQIEDSCIENAERFSQPVRYILLKINCLKLVLKNAILILYQFVNVNELNLFSVDMDYESLCS